MSDEATLRDATTQVDPAAAEHPTGQDPAEKPAAAASTTTTVTTGQDPADKDAAELGKLLIESGYSKDKINDLLAAPNALHSIQNMVRNNAREFITQLERTDPTAAANFLETLATVYVERNEDKLPANSKVNGADSGLMAEINALREKTNQLETREQQREAAKAMVATQARYSQNVDKLFDNEEIKKMELTPAEKKGIRARLDSELGRDPAAVQRINNGNFFDVPRRFKDIIEEWAGDKKTAAEAAKAQRERANSVSAFDFSNGPNPIAGIDPKAVAGGSDEDFEAAFAKALERFA